MIITIKRKDGDKQTPTVTIDTKTCYHPYAIREALELSLKLDGYDESTIKQVFNLHDDIKVPDISEFDSSEFDSSRMVDPYPLLLADLTNKSDQQAGTWDPIYKWTRSIT